MVKILSDGLLVKQTARRRRTVESGRLLFFRAERALVNTILMLSTKDTT